MSKPFVAHICLSTGLGGLELYSMHIHKMFKKNGYPSIHFCLETFGLESKLKEENLDYECIPKSKYFNPTATLKIRNIIKEKNIKVIYVHHLRDLWVLVPALVGMNDVQLIGFAQMFLKDVNKKDFLHTKLYNRMKNLIVLTDIQKEALKKCLPLKHNKYITIPNSVDMSKYSPDCRDESLRNELGVKSEEILIGIVGRLDPWKGQIELVEAFNNIKDRFPNSKLLIVGDETPHEPGYREQIEDFIYNENLQERVILRSFQPDVNRWMASMDIFVMPSYEEAFGIVLIEAMASGLPVISTNAGGVPDILENGKYGQLVEPRSSKAIAAALDNYLSDMNKAKVLAHSSREVALEKYDLNNVYKKVESLIS